MARVSNNAEAPFVVLAWDGTLPGVTNGYDNKREAQEEVDILKAEHPDNEYFVCTQDELVEKVSELTGVAEGALTDPDKTISDERKAAADDKGKK